MALVGSNGIDHGLRIKMREWDLDGMLENEWKGEYVQLNDWWNLDANLAIYSS